MRIILHKSVFKIILYSLILKKNDCLTKVLEVIKYFLLKFLGQEYIKQQALLGMEGISHKIQNFYVMRTKDAFCPDRLSIFVELAWLYVPKELNKEILQVSDFTSYFF